MDREEERGLSFIDQIPCSLPKFDEFTPPDHFNVHLDQIKLP
jgi:hypothetical protein